MNESIIDYRCIDMENGRPKRVSLKTYNQDYKGPTLGSIINMFKGSIVKFANQNNIPFARQSRYHDHIIRNNDEYDRIKYYIQTNIRKWKEDRLNR